jgi:hypothetical protein
MVKVKVQVEMAKVKWSKTLRQNDKVFEDKLHLVVIKDFILSFWLVWMGGKMCWVTVLEGKSTALALQVSVSKKSAEAVGGTLRDLWYLSPSSHLEDEF